MEAVLICVPTLGRVSLIAAAIVDMHLMATARAAAQSTTVFRPMEGAIKRARILVRRLRAAVAIRATRSMQTTRAALLLITVL